MDLDDAYARLELKVEVNYDHDPMDPREWSETKMYCLSDRYNIGDKHDYKPDSFESMGEFFDTLHEDEAWTKNKIWIICPVYFADYGGGNTALSLGSALERDYYEDEDEDEKFNCGSRPSGFMYLLEDAKGNFSNEGAAAQFMEDELKSYAQYMNGEVWCYVIEDRNGEVIESCGGYYDHTDCVAEAASISAQIESEARDTIEKRHGTLGQLPRPRSQRWSGKMLVGGDLALGPDYSSYTITSVGTVDTGTKTK